MHLKSTFRLPLYFDSELYFILPQYFISEFSYAKSLENGVILGQDPEFNHQYRVTLRRIRSLCVLLKEILSPFERKILLTNIKLLMKRTNLLRDLDVFLGDKPRYLAMLSEHEASLDYVFSIIERRHEVEQQHVAAWMQSRMYLKTSVMIDNSLLRALQYENRAKPISPAHYANHKTLKQFNKVSKFSHSITINSSDEEIHSLRIQCKSLRYLLEGFSALYSSSQHKENVKQLKFLQDQLGDFNDASTQIAFFTHLRKDPAVKVDDRKTLNALIKEIKRQHDHSRQSLLLHIQQFNQYLSEHSALELYRT